MKNYLIFFVTILSVSTLISAFDSTFLYGCSASKCSFKFVVPRVVAEYIEENQLLDQVQQIQQKLTILKNLTASDASTTTSTITTASTESSTAESPAPTTNLNETSGDIDFQLNSLQNFTEAFNASFLNVSNYETTLKEATTSTLNITNDLVTQANQLNQTVTKLYQAINCFSDTTKYSSDCYQPNGLTTFAPTTLQTETTTEVSLPTTEAPVPPPTEKGF